MNYDFHQSTFSKAILTGLFAGIFATLACLFYNILFMANEKFSSDIINVSSLIFFVNLVFVVIGIIYYGFLKAFKKGDVIFIAVFALLTLFFIWKAESVHRFTDQILNTEFRHLLLGVTIIMGISAFLIPYLFHNKKFEEHVL
jgi:drug/metabolite transporter (DMT)-like permease